MKVKTRPTLIRNQITADIANDDYKLFRYSDFIYIFPPQVTSRCAMKWSLGIPATGCHSDERYQWVVQLALHVSFLAAEMKHSGWRFDIYI